MTAYRTAKSVLIASSLAVAVALTGCASMRKPPRTFALGQRADLGPSTLTVGIDEVTVRHGCRSQNSVGGRDRDVRLAYLWVTLRNKGRHTLHAPLGLSIHLTGVRGRATPYNSFVSTSVSRCVVPDDLYDGCYDDRAIGPGRNCGGWAVFEVPKGLDFRHEHAEISYCDSAMTHCRLLGSWGLSDKP